MAFSPLIIVLLTALYFGKLQSDGFHKVTETVEEDTELLLLVTNIRRDVKDGLITLRNAVIYTDEDAVQREVEKLDALSRLIRERLDILMMQAETEQQIQTVRHLDTILTTADGYEKMLIEHIEIGNRERAVHLINEELSELEVELQSAINELVYVLETNMFKTLENERNNYNHGLIFESVLTSLLIIIVLLILLRTALTLTSRLERVAGVMTGIADGDLDLTTKVEVVGDDEVGEVARSFNQMTGSLLEQHQKLEAHSWHQSNMAALTSRISGARSYEALGELFFSEIMPRIGAQYGLFYVITDKAKDKDILTLRASYAAVEQKVSKKVRFGEGLIGQCAAEKKPIIVHDVPQDYVSIQAGLGKIPAKVLYLYPVLFEQKVRAIVEIACIEPLGEKEIAFFETSLKELGVILENVIARTRQSDLLEETQKLMKEVQAQAEELIRQQEELQSKNQALEEQTEILQESEEKLQNQQRVLEQLNKELEEKTIRLEKQNKRYEEKNRELEEARCELETKATELAQSSEYKSQFLANVSHELRTPLNSMLILSKLLSENKEDTLSEKQVDYAKTIHDSGVELLNMINDILDLSKIEAGKMDVEILDVSLKEIMMSLDKSFRPVAEEKGLEFLIKVHPDVPDRIHSDPGKLAQILKNLVANAIKFTEEGNVQVEVFLEKTRKKQWLHFVVSDTGIGIEKANQDMIFEAFQQEDGSISRKFGGTGLGLSICKQLAELLGGKILLESERGKGSTFSFVLELGKSKLAREIEKEVSQTEVGSPIPCIGNHMIGDDDFSPKKYRELSGKTVLVVDDDIRNTYALSSLLEEYGMIVRFAENGREAIEILEETDNIDIVLMDLQMPVMDGITALELIRNMPELKDLPVIILTANADEKEKCLNKGAVDFIVKPAEVNRLLESLVKWT